MGEEGGEGGITVSLLEVATVLLWSGEGSLLVQDVGVGAGEGALCLGYFWGELGTLHLAGDAGGYAMGQGTRELQWVDDMTVLVGDGDVRVNNAWTEGLLWLELLLVIT